MLKTDPESRNLRHFYFGNDGSGHSIAEGFPTISARIIQWYRMLASVHGDFDESDSDNLLVLYMHAAQSPAFRALIVMINPVPGLLKTFGRQNSITSKPEQFKTLICRLSDFLTVDSEAQSFLTVSAHPRLARRSKSEFDWDAQFTGLFEFDWKNLEMVLNESAFLPYRIIRQQFFSNNHTGFALIPYELLLKEFVSDSVAPTDLSAYIKGFHFVGLTLCGQQNMRAEFFVDQRRVNEIFIDALFSYCFSFEIFREASNMPITNLLYILARLIFVDGVPENGIRDVTLNAVPSLSLIIIEKTLEFFGNSLAGDVAFSQNIKYIVSFSLALESVENVKSLSSFLKKDHSLALKVKMNSMNKRKIYDLTIC